MIRTPRLHPLVPLLLLLLAVPTKAQKETPPDFNSLRTPPSPAFVLLGIEPSSVERPNTPSDFAATILSATSNLTSVPKDFAVEVSPYWLLSHKRHSWKDDIRRDLIASIQRSFATSIATAQFGTEDRPVRGLAVSFRLDLYSGRLPDSTKEQIMDLERALAGSAARDARRLAPMDQTMLRVLANARTRADSEAVIQEFTELRAKLIEELTESGQMGEDNKELTSMAERLATAREGFRVGLAGGTAWRAPGAVLDSARLDRWGVWLTASHTTAQMSFVAMARYLGSDDADEDAVDIGVRFIYTRDRYALSAEYVDRHATGDGGDDLWRLAGVMDYRVSQTLWLTGTFGRDYDSGDRDSLLATLGLGLHLSKDRYSLSGPGE